MEHLEEIPYRDYSLPKWASKLGPGLAKIHASNRGKRPEWLPLIRPETALTTLHADEWIQLYEELITINQEFAQQYGPIKEGLQTAWEEFRHAAIDEFRNPDQLTLISSDLTPSHWRQKNGLPAFIDWEQARFGPLYFDLPNMLDDKTLKYYYQSLWLYGWHIPKSEFAEKFTVLSRYLGFRYMTVGLEHWLGRQADSLHTDYWETHGKEFFLRCLNIAQHGLPNPNLDQAGVE